MDTKFNKNFEYRGTHLDAKLDNKLDSKLDMVHPKPSHPESVAFYFWQLPPATFYFLMLPLTSSYVFLLPGISTFAHSLYIHPIIENHWGWESEPPRRIIENGG